MVATLATKLEFLVAKEKKLVALATVSVAVSSPVTNTNGKKKDYYFSFLKSCGHICKAYQSNALLHYMDILADCGGRGRFIDW